jgi:hypothetical protein
MLTTESSLPSRTGVGPVEPGAQSLRVVACPRPFSVERVDKIVEAAQTVAGIMREVGIESDRVHARVFLDDVLVERAYWERVRPKPGHTLTVRVVPTGGGGGGKDPLRIVLQLVVIAAAVIATVLTAGALAPTLGAALAWGVGAAAGAAISIAGNLAINALIPPAAPRLTPLAGVGGTQDSATYSLTGSSNRLLPYGTIPCILGRHKLYPPLAARPYTELVGNDQYYRLLFCCGYGPLALSDFKIGTTPLSNFSGIDVEIRQGYATDAALTLFSNAVLEDALSILLTSAASWQVRTSQSLARWLSVDITFAGGLGTYDNQGTIGNRTVQVDVEYRLVGAGGWTSVNSASYPAVAATLETSLAGANNDLAFTARSPGSGGNMTSICYSQVHPWTGDVATGVETVVVSGQYIHVVLLFNGETGEITSTGSSVKAALEASSEAMALIAVAHKAGNDGSGIVANLPQVFLSGGQEGQSISSFNVTEAKAALIRRGLQWQVPADGTYEVRVQRTTGDTTDPLIRDQVYWTALRTIRGTTPVTKSGMALLALRIKATDQLNGIVDQFNCIAQSILPDWNGTSWVTQPTSNPASLYRAILQGPANARALADSRLDLSTLQTWHTECQSAGRQFNAVLDSRTTVYEMLRQIAAAGRASVALRDGKYSVVRDLAQSTPAQTLTPRNSWGYRGHKVFLDPVHAFKVRFINPDKDWQQDEQLVYDDGYSAANATKFETLELFGCTSGSQAWKAGRYHMAVARLRPETHELWMDVENLVCTRGDRVQVVHDVPQFGLGAGRIKAVATDGGGNATGITLDEPIPMEADKSYAVRFRKATGVQVVQQITTAAGEQLSVTFTSAIAAASAPAVGDLVAFGLLNAETVDCLVKSIDPGPDFTAKLTLVDYAPAVQTADTGTIPQFQSQITAPSKIAQLAPPIPVLDQVRSDEEVLVRGGDGSLQPRILISFHFASGAPLVAEGVQVRYRRTGSAEPWQQLAMATGSDRTEVSVMPVEDGQIYDLMLRSVAGGSMPGATSDWVTIAAHTVIGKTTKPADIGTLVLEGRWLRWAYPTPPQDLAGFRVREHAGLNITWATAQPLHGETDPANQTPITETQFLIPLKGGVRTYLVKAVDVAGNESAAPAIVTHDFGELSFETEFGDEVPGNLILSTDLKAAAFPGTVTNGAIVGGNLKANDNGALFWTGDTQSLWTQDNATFWVVLYLEMTYEFTVIPDSDKLDALLTLAATITAGSHTIDYHPDIQSFFWTGDAAPFWSSDSTLFWGTAPGFLSWPGVLQPLSRQTYTFRIKTAPGPTRGEISAMTVDFDVLDLVEDLAAVVISAAGTTRLPLTKTYRAITHVHLTLLDDLGVAESVKAYDKSTTGPLVKAKDGAGVLTSALVDARIKGY